MPLETTVLDFEIGSTQFSARLRADLAPHSCARLLSVLPYRATVIHARWSGEALWSPLGEAWPAGLRLPRENATCQPEPGEVLLYAGDLSEPELLIPYGTVRFACRGGALEGNPVLTIDDPIPALAEIGRQILWNGGMSFKVENRQA